MSRDKQIKEMAKVIARRSKDFRNPNIAFMTTAEKTAESIYNAGYRKASDVAREIFEEIEVLLASLDIRYIMSGNPKQAWGVRGAITEIAELKKKYESEVK